MQPNIYDLDGTADNNSALDLGLDLVIRSMCICRENED